LRPGIPPRRWWRNARRPPFPSSSERLVIPVKAGIVPSSNGKRIELLRELAPKVSRVGDVRGSRQPVLGTGLERSGWRCPLVVHEYVATQQSRGPIIRFAAANRLPAVYAVREDVDEGGLLSYGANVADISRRAARYAGRILEGAKPADLPVEQATRVELCHKHEDRESARPHDPADVAAASGAGNRVAHARPTRPAFAGRGRRSTMKMHLALVVAAVFSMSPIDGVAGEKQVVDVKELAGSWRGWVTAEMGDERATMNVQTDGSYKAATTRGSTSEGKFYLQDGKLRYRSSRTTGTASFSEDKGKTTLTLKPEDATYGKAEYERVK